MDWLYSLSGFLVGLIVGVTGVGGGSLMTPLLVLVFGVAPVTAVGTDLLFAALTKTGGAWAHARRSNVAWNVVGWLAAGSVPASAVTLVLLHLFVPDPGKLSAIVSVALGFAIILTAGATLHAQGITDVHTSAEAAKALAPIAGRFASALFACGIVGTGLLAIPVLAASAAYGVGEACRWRVSLEKTPREAIRFYAAICAATLVGLSLNFVHVDPVRALFWAAILNGLAAAPLMSVIMIMASSRKVMGKFVLSRYLQLVGWGATAVMGGISLAMFFVS